MARKRLTPRRIIEEKTVKNNKMEIITSFEGVDLYSGSTYTPANTVDYGSLAPFGCSRSLPLKVTTRAR